MLRVYRILKRIVYFFFQSNVANLPECRADSSKGVEDLSHLTLPEGAGDLTLRKVPGTRDSWLSWRCQGLESTESAGVLILRKLPGVNSSVGPATRLFARFCGVDYTIYGRSRELILQKVLGSLFNWRSWGLDSTEGAVGASIEGASNLILRFVCTVLVCVRLVYKFCFTIHCLFI